MGITPEAAFVEPSLRDLVSDAPQQFRCQMDGRLLVDPVRTPSGHLFERSTLARVLKASGGFCPLTGVPLELKTCQRDGPLRQQILSWVRQNQPRRALCK